MKSADTQNKKPTLSFSQYRKIATVLSETCPNRISTVAPKKKLMRSINSRCVYRKSLKKSAITWHSARTQSLVFHLIASLN